MQAAKQGTVCHSSPRVWSHRWPSQYCCWAGLAAAQSGRSWHQGQHQWALQATAQHVQTHSMFVRGTQHVWSGHTHEQMLVHTHPRQAVCCGTPCTAPCCSTAVQTGCEAAKQLGQLLQDCTTCKMHQTNTPGSAPPVTCTAPCLTITNWSGVTPSLAKIFPAGTNST
jgi:hypothetical protein